LTKSDTQTTIASAGNVLPAALACLRSLGYEVALTNDGCFCRATRDNNVLVAEDTLQLLGLAKLEAKRGSDWRPSDPEVESYLTFDDAKNGASPNVTTSKCEVYFRLCGDEFEPDKVSQYIGLVATRTRRKGERRKDVPLPRNSTWQFSTGVIESDVIDVYEMSAALVERLAPYTSKIAEAKAIFQLTCVLQVVLWIDQNEEKSMPAIGFEQGVIDFLKAVGGTIDIDTYRN
jgi:hypothetical protein